VIKDVVQRFAASETWIFKLEIGCGGGKAHSLIASAHAARASSQARGPLRDCDISRFPEADSTQVAAFVAEESSPGCMGHRSMRPVCDALVIDI
jgi:hypothetical protein